VLKYHKNSAEKALLDLFPDIGLDPTLFTKDSQKREAKRGAAKAEK
jgi:hypothetical protein